MLIVDMLYPSILELGAIYLGSQFLYCVFHFVCIMAHNFPLLLHILRLNFPLGTLPSKQSWDPEVLNLLDSRLGTDSFISQFLCL